MASNQGPGPMPNVLRPAPMNGSPKRAADAPDAQNREYTTPPKPVSTEKPIPIGCSFTKPCKLPNGTIDYVSPSGAIPTDAVNEYGELILLGARQTDPHSSIPLKKINGNALPTALGTLSLDGAAFAAGKGIAAIGSETGAGLVTAGVATGVLVGVVALLWPSSLGDSSLYTDEQLRSLKKGRTRVRFHVEQQSDGTLKGYGYNTQKRRDWEMIPVVQFRAQRSQQVADFGNGVTLIWTPAVKPSDTLGIPALGASPRAPHIWIYPPTEQADNMIIDPIHPPDYKDFILVFPANSGIKPLYIVLSLSGLSYQPKPDFLPAFPDAKWAKSKTSIQGGHGLRPRWKSKDGTIYEWDFQHGAVEKYNKRGKHLGEFDHETGHQNKPADPARKVEP